jgi:hypothetical protein
MEQRKGLERGAAGIGRVVLTTIRRGTRQAAHTPASRPLTQKVE